MNFIPDRDLVQDGIVMQRTAEGKVETNVMWNVKHHSPDGFEWGYAGSGPADFALNAMEAILTRIGYDGPMMQYNQKSIIYSLTAKYYQDFKEFFLANIPEEGGVLPWPVVNLWVLEKIEREMEKA